MVPSIVSRMPTVTRIVNSLHPLVFIRVHSWLTVLPVDQGLLGPEPVLHPIGAAGYNAAGAVHLTMRDHG